MIYGFRWTGEGNGWSGLGLEIDWEEFGEGSGRMGVGSYRETLLKGKSLSYRKISEVLKSDYGHKVSHDTVGRILSGG